MNIINVGYSENNFVYLTCDSTDALTVLSNDGEMCLPVCLLVLLMVVLVDDSGAITTTPATCSNTTRSICNDLLGRDKCTVCTTHCVMV